MYSLDPVKHNRTKHIDLDRFYIKEKLEEKVLLIEYVPTTEQCADILTKGLLVKQFSRLISKLGLRSIHSCELDSIEQMRVLVFSPFHFFRQSK